jgi:hypothetical protein
MKQLTDTRLTHSQIQTAMTCPRKHYIQYVLGLRPATEAKALRIGSAFHQGLDLWAKGSDVEEAKRSALAMFDESATRISMTEDDHFDYLVDRQILWYLLHGHFWRWQEENITIKHLASELSFEIPIINPDSGRASRNFVLAGKIDGVIQFDDGRVAIMEHKTRGGDISPEADYWQRLRIDQQISIYFIAGQKLGYKPDMIYYNVARKPEITPKQIPLVDDEGVKIVLDAHGERVKTKDGKKYRETGDKEAGYVLQTRQETPEEYGQRVINDMQVRPEFYFARKEIPRTQIQMDDAQQDIWQMTQVIRDCDKCGRWPRNTGACIGFGRCPYFLLCTNSWDIESEETPDGFIRVDNVHQELDE